MATRLFNQILSFSAAALITVAILAGIDRQAQPAAIHPHWATVPASQA